MRDDDDDDDVDDVDGTRLDVTDGKVRLEDEEEVVETGAT